MISVFSWMSVCVFVFVCMLNVVCLCVWEWWFSLRFLHFMISVKLVVAVPSRAAHANDKIPAFFVAKMRALYGVCCTLHWWLLSVRSVSCVYVWCALVSVRIASDLLSLQCTLPFAGFSASSCFKYILCVCVLFKNGWISSFSLYCVCVLCMCVCFVCCG